MSKQRKIRQDAEAVLGMPHALAEKAAKGLGYSMTSEAQGHPEQIWGRIRLAALNQVTGSLVMWKTDNPNVGHMEIGEDPAVMLSSLMINKSLSAEDVAEALAQPNLSRHDGSLGKFVTERMADRGINVLDDSAGWREVLDQEFASFNVWTREEAEAVLEKVVRIYENRIPQLS